MADALVERRPPARFFCHRCNIEFEDVLQDYTCPYCASGFIEQLENEAEAPASGDDFSDADMSNLDEMSTIDEMSNLDDSDEMHQWEGRDEFEQAGIPLRLEEITEAQPVAVNSTPPVINDLAFLMSGGRLRGAGRRETLMEQLVWMIGGARGGAAVAAGAPFVLVGAPGDYVFGGEGLDAVVTQLLGQLENAGPPPLPREQIAAIPSEPVTPEQAATNTSCSVCWEAFQVGETISRLECDHIFHSSCIAPWLQLHATCPICRRSLLPEDPPAPPGPPVAESTPSRDAASESTSAPHSETSTTSLPRLVLRRISARQAAGAGAAAAAGAGAAGAGWARAASTSSSCMSTTSGSAGDQSDAAPEPASPSPSARSTTNSTNSSDSTSSLSSSDRDPHHDRQQYNMDIDFD